MGIQYGQLARLNLLLLVALLAALAIAAMLWQRRAMLQFATANLIGDVVTSRSLARKITSVTLTTLTLIAITLALVDIRWGKIWRDVPQSGIEVIFALDVSRSMLAEDAAPNRLQRAKQDIKDMVNQMSGDRVGLVIFAGSARRHIPLTSHYDDFKQTLDEVGPHNLDRGGSNLGEAIEVATGAFLEKTSDHKAIVLFTDGEDTVSEPIKAATLARSEDGVRIFTVGLGDIDQGARIPVETSRQRRAYVQHDGQPVWSKLNGDVLREVADVSDGAYIPAGTKQVDMAGVYHRFIATMSQQEFNTARINTYVPRYPWFLGFALATLLLDVLWGATQRSGKSQNVASRAFAETPVKDGQKAA